MDSLIEALKSRKPKQPAPPAEYRLYYTKETGEMLYYSMEDIDGDYIVIDRETFVKGKKGVHVVDGKLHEKVYTVVYKLVPADNGTPCAKDDITIVDYDSDVYWGNKVESKEIK